MRSRQLMTFAIAFVCLQAGAWQLAAPSAAPSYEELGKTAAAELGARQFDKVFAQFDSTMQAAMPAGTLAQTWDQIIGQMGAFQKITGARVVEQSGYHVALVACEFEKGALEIVLPFKVSGQIAGLHFQPAEKSAATAASSWSAPAYADAAKFHEEAVTVADGNFQLPGTLTLPNGKGPFPAVVLLSGSGPNDADESIAANKPFKDLAWGLATQGIAVLRYPKRTYQYRAKSSADPMNFTVKDEYMDDAKAAVALVGTRPEIDARKIFVAGHSEGGYLAPRIAAGDTRIAGLVILEGSTRPMEQLVIEQLQYQAKLAGPDAGKVEPMIEQAKKDAAAIESPDLKPGTAVSLLGAQMPSSYFLDLRAYDAGGTAASLKIPIYVTQGGRDFQVTMADYANWQKALGGHKNATLKVYPELNHLLIAGTGPATPAEYAHPGHVAPQVISDIAAWISGVAK